MSHPRKSRTSRFLGFLAVCGFSAALVACSVAEPAPPLSAEARHLAEQWQALRTKPGHFSGAAWDDQVDKWQGSKHRLMQQLLELAWSQRYDAAQLRALLGTPDRVWTSDSDGYANWLRLTEWRGQPAGELWAYEWRGQHDQLLFAVEGEQVRAAGWLFMYE